MFYDWRLRVECPVIPCGVRILPAATRWRDAALKERWRPAAMAHAQSKDSRLAAFFLHISWAVGKMPTLREGGTQGVVASSPPWPMCRAKTVVWRPFLAHLMGCGQDAHSP